MVYKRIIYNMQVPYQFVHNGLRRLTIKSNHPLLYSCRESRLPKFGNCAPGIGAYTSDPVESENNNLWTITFCPDFFKLDYAENMYPAGAKGLVPSDLNARRPYEVAIIHEWFHVDWMGYTADKAPHIDDVEAVFSGKKKKVYGATAANQFAYLKRNSVNVDVARNADNYANYFLARWLINRYGGLNNKWKAQNWCAPDPDCKAGRPPAQDRMIAGFSGNDTLADNATFFDNDLAV
jgi:hypothetical protein